MKLKKQFRSESINQLTRSMNSNKIILIKMSGKFSQINIQKYQSIYHITLYTKLQIKQKVIKFLKATRKRLLCDLRYQALCVSQSVSQCARELLLTNGTLFEIP